MKVATVLSAAFLALTPVVASAQDASSTGRANGDKPVGPASENGDNTTSNTKNPERIRKVSLSRPYKAGRAERYWILIDGLRSAFRRDQPLDNRQQYAGPNSAPAVIGGRKCPGAGKRCLQAPRPRL